MMPTATCNATPGPVSAAGKTADQRNGSDAGDSGFAGLLSGPGKTPVAATKQTPAKPDTARGGTPARPAEPHEPEVASQAAEPPETTEAPEQLLSLLGTTWPPSTTTAPMQLPSGRLPPGAVATTTATVDGTLLPAPIVGVTGDRPAALSMPAGSTPAGVDGTVPLTPLMPAMASMPTGTASGAALGAGQALPAPADFAASLGSIKPGTAVGETTTNPMTEPGEYSPVQALTAGTTATSPATSTKLAAAPLASPALAMPSEPGAGFDDAFGARIGWLADQRIGRAEIRITPEHLGAIDIRLQIDGSRISAEFNSTQADVRQALEASLGRLRDLLGQQGLQLAHADVGHRHGSDTSSGGEHRPTDEVDAEMEPIDLSTATMIRSRGLLDEYA